MWLPTKVRVCIDYRKLNTVTRNNHFALPFIDQILEWLVGHEYFCFLDSYLGPNQNPIAPEDQEKITFTCPFGTFAYRWLPFGLCKTHTTFQCCNVKPILRNGWKIFRDLYGWFLHLWILIRPMSLQSRTYPKMIYQKEFDFKLEKVPLHDIKWDCSRSWDFQERDRSGQSEDRYYS